MSAIHHQASLKEGATPSWQQWCAEQGWAAFDIAALPVAPPLARLPETEFYLTQEQALLWVRSALERHWPSQLQAVEALYAADCIHLDAIGHPLMGEFGM